MGEEEEGKGTSFYGVVREGPWEVKKRRMKIQPGHGKEGGLWSQVWGERHWRPPPSYWVVRKAV